MSPNPRHSAGNSWHESRTGGATTVEDDAPVSILTRQEVANWLKVNPRQVERLGIPCVDMGRKTKRYLVKDVLEWIRQHRAG
jgi:hypothetical protein